MGESCDLRRGWDAVIDTDRMERAFSAAHGDGTPNF